jgi:predicted amidohydrolase
MAMTMYCRARVFTLIALLIVAAPIPAAAAEDDFTVAAVQAELRFWPTADNFTEHMSRLVEESMQHDPDLIAFPEDIGLPLVGLGDTDVLTGADSLQAAVTAMLARHAGTVGERVAAHGVSPQRALWLAKAPTVCEVYRETFSALAAEHDVHIVAGSVPMVSPVDPARILNTACVFDPSGAMNVVGRKVHLVPLERADGLDFAAGSIDDYAVFEMPEATLGVIICADAWNTAIARKLVRDGANVLVQVSANPEEWSADTRANWQRGLCAQVQELGVFGVSVMGVGELLGLPLQGRSAALAPRDWTEDGSGYLAEADSATEEATVVVTFDLAFPERD